MAALEAEIGNLWSAVAFGLEEGDGDLVRSIVAALPMYWIMRGRFAEARSWLDRAIRIDPTKDDLRRRLLSGLATIASLQGDHVVAVEAADEAGSSSTRISSSRSATPSGNSWRFTVHLSTSPRGLTPDEDEAFVRQWAETRLGRAMSPESVAGTWAAGRERSLGSMVAEVAGD